MSKTKPSDKSAKPTKKAQNKSYVMAKTDDGTVQITFTIPWATIQKTKDEVIKHHAKNVNVPGFRKGKAPAGLAAGKMDEEHIVQDTLGQILPEYLANAITEEKLNLAIYPKFELISAEGGKDWQVKATTCELPEVKLGDYKKEIKGQAASHSLVTSTKDAKSKEEPTREQKEHVVMHAILESSKVTLPKILVEEEVSSRLSKLLERIEKLGLSLEQYITSLGKKIEDVKADYEKSAREALILDLALPQIAQKEGVAVDEKAVEEAIKATTADPALAQRFDTPQERAIVKSILLKRATVDKLVAYLN